MIDLDILKYEFLQETERDQSELTLFLIKYSVRHDWHIVLAYLFKLNILLKYTLLIKMATE